MLKKIVYSMAVMGLLVTPLVAATENGVEEEHVMIAERSLAVEDAVALKERRAQEEEENAADLAVAGDDKLPQVVEKGIFSDYPRFYQGSHHWATNVSFFGDAVELEDGSIWKVYFGDAYKTLGWLTSDRIYIKPNDEYFSIYDYKIVNVTTEQVVKANLSVGPHIFGVFTLDIVATDFFADRIILSDGTSWNISSFDSDITDSWLVGDIIIVGVNESGYLSVFNPYILINVNINDYARASLNY